MNTFPLATLPTFLLEKVITKLEVTSYIRIQQTCHDMYGFVRANRNIVVYDCNDYRLDKKGLSLIFRFPIKFVRPRHVRDFYGMRLNYISVLEWAEDFFDSESLCRDLAKYRVQCEELDTKLSNRWTKEEYIKLLNILKPISIVMTSTKSNRYESVFQTPTLRDVSIELDLEHVLTATPKLLSTYRNVDINVNLIRDPYSLFAEILKILFSKPYSNLQNFCCYLSNGDFPFSRRQLEENFPNFKWILWKYSGRRELVATVPLPKIFPAYASCEITFSVNFYYESAAAFCYSITKPSD